MPPEKTEHEKYISFALKEAEIAYQYNEVPIGAVIVHEDKIIACAHNLIETANDATCHAEILAISQASEVLKNWRLNSCTIYVTLEPCIMCMGAIHNSRISRVVYGAYDKVAGACGSVTDLRFDIRGKKNIEYIGGILEENCINILQRFFRERRG